MNKIIGQTTQYQGTEFKFLTGQKVRILGVLKNNADPDSDDAIIKDQQHLNRLGGVNANDRIEIQPWIEKEGRFSWVTSDLKAIDLACFEHLARK